MSYSFLFAFALMLFSPSIFARTTSTEPNASGYVQLREFLHQRFGVPLGKKCFSSIKIPSRNCRIEISEAPSCQYDWAWDQILIKVEAGERKQSFFALGALTFAVRFDGEFVYHQYERESEEGHYTGPLYLNDVMTFTDRKLTLSNYISNPQYTKTVTCDLE